MRCDASGAKPPVAERIVYDNTVSGLVEEPSQGHCGVTLLWRPGGELSSVVLGSTRFLRSRSR